jgi:hypothetical protein
LSLLLAFVAALGPVLSHGRRILSRGDGEVRAQLLLRALLERTTAAGGVRDGETDGFRWRVAAEPFTGATFLQPGRRDDGAAASSPWSLYKMTARVDWGRDQSLSAESLRLIKAE